MDQSNATLIFSNTTNGNLQNYSTCENSLAQKVIKILSYVLLILFSLVGNSLVVTMFFRKQELRTPVNYFIANMSVSDLCIPIFALPRRLNWLIVGSNKWLLDGLLGSILCKFLPFAEDVSTYVSKLSMVVIAVERFYSIVFALKPPRITNRSCPRLIAVTWFISVLFSAHFFYSFRLIHTDGDALECAFQWDPASETANAFKIQWIVNFVCFTAVPLVLLTVLYISIATSLHRQKKSLQLASKMARQRGMENRKITCMLATVMVVFIAAYAPYHVHILLYYLAPAIERPCSFRFIADYSQFTYTAINPLVYYIFNDNYRRGFSDLLCFAKHSNLGRKCTIHRASSPETRNLQPNAEVIDSQYTEVLELHVKRNRDGK